MDCEFKLGDTVIDTYGRIGIIDGICTCEKCKERGFDELIVKWDDSGDEHYITNYQAENGFPDWYMLGNTFFPHNVDVEKLDCVIKNNNIEIYNLTHTNQRIEDFIKEVKAFAELQDIMEGE